MVAGISVMQLSFRRFFSYQLKFHPISQLLHVTMTRQLFKSEGKQCGHTIPYMQISDLSY